MNMCSILFSWKTDRFGPSLVCRSSGQSETSHVKRKANVVLLQRCSMLTGHSWSQPWPIGHQCTVMLYTS